jgi:predicted ATPase/predicted Ser/Thr protein kinase
MIGRKLGRYHILEEIGSGGMGVVYRALDERLERDVALKVLPEGRLSDVTARKRFIKEAKALSKLNHPNIATVHDFDTQEGRDFLVMEYITGESLDEKLSSGALPEKEVLRLGIQIVEGLVAAHKHGVIHRDIKPGNFRVTLDGRIKILDFGLALLLRPVTDTVTTDSALTDALAVVGTVPYMAPEQLKGEAVDERTDVYGAGAVLYEMVTGRRPFPEPRSPQLIASILNRAPEPPREVNRGISSALERIILKALEKQVERRYPSSQDLLEDLLRLSSSDARPKISVSPPPFMEREEEQAHAGRPLFVARVEELAKLSEFLQSALRGNGRVAFVTGEAGSGKTALVGEFVRHAQEAHAELIVAGANCNAHTGVGDPYLPFREALGLLTGDVEARWEAGAISSDHAARLWHALPSTVRALVESGPDLIDVLVPGRPLLERARESVPDGTDWLTKLQEIVERKAVHPAASSPPQSVLFEQYSRLLQSLTREVPVLLVMDDLQWADAGSIGLLLHLIEPIESSRLLILGTYRSDEVTQDRDGERHPLRPAVNACKTRFGDIEVLVGRTGGREFVNAYVDSEPNILGETFREAFYRHTEGHSLFVVEVLRGMQDQGALVRDDEGRWVEREVDWEKLPTRVEAMIGERIERLPENMREVLRLASAEGEYFAAEVVARVLVTGEREMVRLLSHDLDKRYHLVSARDIRRINGRRISLYRFRHILFQKHLYNTMDKVERSYLHEEIGNVLESIYGGRTEEIAVQLARHFQEAGDNDKAIEYLRQAGTGSMRVSANEEAAAHLKKALELLKTCPDTPERIERELLLQAPLSTALMLLRGYGDPDAGDAFRRAYALCDQIGETTQIIRVLSGLWAFYVMRAEYKPAVEIAEDILRRAPRSEDPDVARLIGHNAQAGSFFVLGEPEESLKHAEQVIDIHDSSKHSSLLLSQLGQDVKGASLCWASYALWFLGYSDRSRETAQRGIAFCRELDHPFTLCFSLNFTARLHLFIREIQVVQELMKELRVLSEEYGFRQWLGSVSIYEGRTLVEQGESNEGVARIRRGMAVFRATGSAMFVPFYFNELAESLGKAGQAEEGLAVLDEARTLVERTGERFYEAELHRLNGELLLKQGANEVDVERHYQKAIEVARHQNARSLELRATVSLCRMRQARGTQDKREEARQMLEAIYGWFTEGFDTADLQEAKALLEEK